MPKIDCAADAIRAAANGDIPLQYSNHSAERLSIYPLLDSRLPQAEFAATIVTLDAAKTARLQAMLNAAAQEADEAWPLERQKALRALYRANLSSSQQKALDPARHADARFIAAGACNPTAIAGVLHRHCLALVRDGADTTSVRADPALRLIAHQLASLFATGELDADLSAYRRALDAVAPPA